MRQNWVSRGRKDQALTAVLHHVSALQSVHILKLRPHTATVVQRPRKADTGAATCSYICILRPVKPKRLVSSDEAWQHMCALSRVSKHDDEAGPPACKQMDEVLNIYCVLW